MHMYLSVGHVHVHVPLCMCMFDVHVHPCICSLTLDYCMRGPCLQWSQRQSKFLQPIVIPGGLDALPVYSLQGGHGEPPRIARLHALAVLSVLGHDRGDLH